MEWCWWGISWDMMNPLLVEMLVVVFWMIVSLLYI